MRKVLRTAKVLKVYREADGSWTLKTQTVKNKYIYMTYTKLPDPPQINGILLAEGMSVTEGEEIM